MFPDNEHFVGLNGSTVLLLDQKPSDNQKALCSSTRVWNVVIEGGIIRKLKVSVLFNYV